MGHSKGNDIVSVMEMLNMGRDHPMLRDEIYCQLVKQTTNCPERGALVKAFKLLYLCLSSFAISPEVSLVVLSKISQFAKPQGFSAFRTCLCCFLLCVERSLDDCTVGEIAAACFVEWKKNNEVGPSQPYIQQAQVERIMVCFVTPSAAPL